jgi:hypothetical protein
VSRPLDQVGCHREPLDAPENLPTEAPRQVAFGKLEDEVLGMLQRRLVLERDELAERMASCLQPE